MKKNVMLIAMFVLILCGAELLQAAQQWQEPLCVRSGRNINFMGDGIDCSDGGYLLSWIETNSLVPQTVFQRYNADNEPLWPEPKIIASEAIYLAMEEVDEGCFVILMQNDRGDTKVFKVNSAGDHVWSSDGYLIVDNFSQPSAICKSDNYGGVFIVLSDHYRGIRVNHVSSNGAITNHYGLFLGYPYYSYNYYPGLLIMSNGDAIIDYIDSGFISHIVRITTDLTIVWERELPVSGRTCSTLVDDNSFVVVTAYQDISIMRFDLNGDPVWDEYITLADSTSYYFSKIAIAVRPDGRIMVGWLTADSAMIQQIDMSGTLIAEPEQAMIPLDHANGKFSLQVVDNDTAYMVIGETYNFVYYSTLLINHDGFVSGDKIPLFQAMNYGYAYPQPFIRLNGSYLQFIYDRAEGDVSQIEYGLVTTSGHLIAANTCLVGGTLALVSEIQVTPNSDCILVTWREVDLDYPRYKIRYQLVSPDGVMLLEEPGALPANAGNITKCYYKTVSLESGEVVVLWLNMAVVPEIRAQLIDAGGNQLWEPEGRLIYAGSVLALTDNDPLCVSIIDNAIYVVWLQEVSPLREIRGQKIVNGELQWELGGKTLIAFASDQWNLISLDGNYIVFERWFSESNFGDRVGVFAFDENGLAPPGFEPGGIFPSILPSSYIIHSIKSIFSPNGLILRTDNGEIITDSFGTHPSYLYPFEHLVTPAGELPWGIYGAGIPPAYLLTADETGIYERYDVDEYQTLVKRSYDSTQIWTVPCILTQQNWNRGDYGAVSIGDGLYLGVGSFLDLNYFRALIYYGFDSFGNVVVPDDKIVGELEYNQGASLGSLDNNAYAGWLRNYSDNWQSGTSVFLQKLNLETVGNQDQVEQARVVTFRSNSPNPFSQSTEFRIQSTSSALVVVDIYNVRGQLVRSLYQGLLAKGDSSFEWDGKDNRGAKVGSGVYFCRIQTNGVQQDVHKILKINSSENVKR